MSKLIFALLNLNYFVNKNKQNIVAKLYLNFVDSINNLPLDQSQLLKTIQIKAQTKGVHKYKTEYQTIYDIINKQFVATNTIALDLLQIYTIWYINHVLKNDNMTNYIYYGYNNLVYTGQRLFTDKSKDDGIFLIYYTKNNIPNPNRTNIIINNTGCMAIGNNYVPTDDEKNILDRCSDAIWENMNKSLEEIENSSNWINDMFSNPFNKIDEKLLIKGVIKRIK